MGIHRFQRFILGGHLEVLGGARFVSFGEQYRIEGSHKNRGPTPDDPGAHPALLGTTIILNEAENNIMGPSVGVRWFKSFPYCVFSIEGQFLPGLNAQAVRLRSTIDDQRDAPSSAAAGLLFQNSSNDSFHDYVFSPVGELTASVSFQLTRAIAVRAGWTGMYIDNLARPSNMVLYRIPDPEIIEQNNGDNAMMQGAHIGIEINR
jgi:hypothetical protein